MHYIEPMADVVFGTCLLLAVIVSGILINEILKYSNQSDE
jgi:hypothetical protein